ncbi:hemolysin family protein [Rosenbergiella epipactidis]|uniref:hemolysin family protein n=1 Tax=Rosenbergiella epipactidis TaxID=1544694 RepID=UPI001F4F03ED|nr:hemolysin family protein [Rosenbergiella epipactidis]
MLDSLLVILVLIVISFFFAMSEISLAAARKIKLRLLANDGDIRAEHVLKLQESPGMFFTVVQIGVNAVAILGGIVGDSAFMPVFSDFFHRFLSPELSEKLSFICSFTMVTSLFILFADLTPKRIGMIAPEAIALRIIGPMRICLLIFRPLVWFFNGMANNVFRLFKIPMDRKDDITPDDIYAVVEAGALAGVLRKQEHELIENVFELESRTVPSSMTSRENIVWFDLNEEEAVLKSKIADHPHSKFLVCNGDIDHIVGYVDSKELLLRVLGNQSMTLSSGVQIRSALIVPDTLTLSEALESFKTAGEDFAVIMNEYALVVGIITLNDVMTTLMGDLVGQGFEEQIVARDANSWLVEGGTPIDDVVRVLHIEEFPHSGNYETIGGFMMYMLRKIPKRTDFVIFSGYKFEVVDIDNYRIDQLLVTRVSDERPTPLTPAGQVIDEITGKQQ